jgi:hypothetical protein
MIDKTSASDAIPILRMNHIRYPSISRSQNQFLPIAREIKNQISLSPSQTSYAMTVQLIVAYYSPSTQPQAGAMRHFGKFKNLHALYCLLAGGWAIYDNSGPAPQLLEKVT